MKVQLQRQCLRLRIDEAELARLQAGERIENLSILPGGCTLRQQLRLLDSGAPALQPLQDGFCFVLPTHLLAPYVARLPCRDGLQFTLPVLGEDAIEIHFEVDVRDSVRNRGAPKR